MPDLLLQALALPGLGWLCLGAILSGLVRGFSGFGTALVFLPLAALAVSPVWALICLTVMDVFGPLPILRNAWRTARRKEVARLVFAMAVTLPLGVMLLLAVRPETFRYAVSVVAIAVPLLLLSGWRFRKKLTPGVLYATGALSGISGGAIGLPGPPVILLYMSSTARASVVRANTMLFLYAFDLGLLAAIALAGRLEPLPVLLGLMIAPLAILGNITGAIMFRENRERLYRFVGLGVIVAAALRGLPLWDQLAQ